MGIAGFALLWMCSGMLYAGDGGREQSREVRVEFRIENATGVGSDTFSPGERVRIVFSVINDSPEAANLSYTFPPHRVQIEPVGSDVVVWEAHYGKMFPQMMKHKVIAAGDRLEFVTEWDLHFADNPEKRVPLGDYEVQPEFHAFVDDRKLPSALPARRITVRGQNN